MIDKFKQYWSDLKLWQKVGIVIVLLVSYTIPQMKSSKPNPCDCIDVYVKEDFVGYGNLSNESKKLYNRCNSSYYNRSAVDRDCINSIIGY